VLRTAGANSAGYSAAIRGGLIEAAKKCNIYFWPAEYSAAIRGGLIEANLPGLEDLVQRLGIPPRFAAASLKRALGAHADNVVLGIPPRFAAASLKQNIFNSLRTHLTLYSAAIRGGLIEATAHLHSRDRPAYRIPPRFAAASLKLDALDHLGLVVPLYSAAIRGGLIEANGRSRTARVVWGGIPPRFAAASLKRTAEKKYRNFFQVFRRDSRRPH